MSYGPMPLQGDSESLQTDVMRFMAIIGFCLIAILALVKEATPGSQTSAPVPAPAQIEITSVAEPANQPSPASTAEPVTAPRPTSQALSVAPSPAATRPRWEQPLPSLIPEPATPRPTPKPRSQTREQPKPQTSLETAATAAPPPAQSEPALSLRFASDKDFLRLIAKGDIEVYAYHGARQDKGTPAANPAATLGHRSDPGNTGTLGTLGKEILKLDGNYQFRDSPAPGRVYELLPQTIPRLVINALQTTGRDINAFTWAIVLPPRIEAQLERHLGQVSSGELVIDRHGEVQHVAPG